MSAPDPDRLPMAMEWSPPLPPWADGKAMRALVQLIPWIPSEETAPEDCDFVDRSTRRPGRAGG